MTTYGVMLIFKDEVDAEIGLDQIRDDTILELEKINDHWYTVKMHYEITAEADSGIAGAYAEHTQ